MALLWRFIKQFLEKALIMTTYHKVSGSSRPKSGLGSKATHKIKAVKPRENVAENTGLQVSNSEFLSEIFRGTSSNLYSWTTFFADRVDSGNTSKWLGLATTPKECLDIPAANAYFSVSQFDIDKKPLGRTSENFVRMGCIVLDDAQSAKLMPSWKLETSPNNYQLGFILKDPITDRELAKRLLEAIRDASFVNQSDKSGNNIVRYARLPVGFNNKSKYDKPFTHVMHEWQPSLRYTLDELISGLNLDREAVLSGGNSNEFRDPFEDYGRGLDISQIIREILASERYYEPLLKLSSHLIGTGNSPSSTIAQSQGIMQAVINKPADWKFYYDQIPSLVNSAAKKFSQTKVGSKYDLDWMKENFKDYNYSDDAPVATNFVIDGFLSDEIFAIAGAPGTGKSSMLFQLAMAVAHLCPPDYELKPILRRKVVYLTEDARQAENLIYGMKKWGGVTTSTKDMHEWFGVIEVRRIKPEFLEAFIEWKVSEKTVVQKGENGKEILVPPLIVFDTAAATFDLENESDNSEVSDAIGHVKHACSLNNTPLWIVAHSSKAQRNDTEDIQIRGASAWTGDVHGTAYIFAEPGMPSRYMRLRKRRFEAEFEELEFTTQTHSIPVQHPLGHWVDKTYRVGFCKKSSHEARLQKQKEHKEVEAKRREQDMQMHILRRVHGLSLRGVTKTSKRSIQEEVVGQAKTINAQIDNLVDLGELVKTSDGKFSLGNGEMVKNIQEEKPWP